MTAFDRIFDESAKASGLSWIYLYGAKEANALIDRHEEKYPCIIRAFAEPLQPLFDAQSRVTRQLNLYIINTKFQDEESDVVTAGFEEIMTKFIAFREFLRRAGIQVEMTQTPFPNWQNFDCDEYGYIFNLNCTYSLCLS